MKKEAKKELTWEELADVKPGTILYDETEDNVRFIVMRGPYHLCAYVGIAPEHPLAGFGYNDVPLPAHGGLTFAQAGGKGWPEGWYWYGWDYGHYADASFMLNLLHAGKQWTVLDVVEDSWEALYIFKALAQLAEKITTKALGWRAAIAQS